MTDSPVVSRVPQATDGGWGWMVVLGSFLAYFIADGWSYSFGVFYPELLGYFQEGKGVTALIGALLYGTPMLVSPIVCALTMVYGCRLVCIVGGVITGLSFVLSAFANSVGFLCFSTGVLASVGLALTYIPAFFIVTFHFERKRGLATGLALTGSGIGAFAFPPLMEHLLDKYAWRGMLLVFGGICFNIIIAGCLFRPPPMNVPDELKEEETLSKPVDGVHVKCSSSNVLMPRLHSREPAKDRSSSVEMLSATGSAADHKSRLHLSQMLPPSPLDIGSEQDNQLMLQQQDDDPRTSHWASSPDLYVNKQSDIHEQTVDFEPITTQHCGQRFLTELKALTVSMLDKSLLYNWTYLLYVASGFIMFLWIGVPYVYLVDFALDYNISSQQASFLLSYIAIGRTVGMIALGWVGDWHRVNVVLLYGICAGICGVGTMCVPLCTNYASLAVFSTTFGFFISVTYVLPMMNLVAIVGLEKSSSAFGIFQLVQGIATLLGTPLAGWLYDKTMAYDTSFYVSGGWVIISGLMLLPAPIMLRRSTHAKNSDKDVTA